MTLLPGVLATAPAPSRASASPSSSRSADSGEFASALEGALGGAAKPSGRRAEKSETAQASVAGEGATPAAEVGTPLAQLSLMVPVVPPVVPGEIVMSDELIVGVPEETTTGSSTDLGAVLSVAADAVADAGVVPPASGEPAAAAGIVTDPIRAAVSGPTPAAVSALPIAPAGAVPVAPAAGATVSPTPAGTAGGAAGVVDVQPAATQAVPTHSSPVAVTTTGADSAAAVGAAAVGAVAASAVASAPAAGTTTITSPATASAASAVQPTAVPAAGGFADTGGGASDQGQNNHGQLGMPSSVAAPIAQQGVQPTAATYAAVAASQSDATASAPLSTQIARPLFSLANAAHGEHVMTISITPENLGPVTVRAHVGPEGVRVELFAPNDAGRDALRSILADLKRDLAGSGMTGATLDLSNRDQAGNAPQQDRQADPANRGRASVSARESVGDTAPTPERLTVPTWYGGIPSIDVMA